MASGRSSTFLLSVWIGFTVVVTFIANFWFAVLSPRRLLLLTPALATLTARGLANFKNPARIFLVAVIVIYGVSTVDDYYPKAPGNSVAANLVKYAHPDELVLMEIYRDDMTMDYYIDQLLGTSAPRELLRLWREMRPKDYPNKLIDEINQYPTVWLIYWNPDQSAFKFLAQTGHVQTAKMSVNHVGNSLDVFRFDRMPDQPVGAYANGMTLRMDKIAPNDLRVDLWWSSDQTLTNRLHSRSFCSTMPGSWSRRTTLIPSMASVWMTSWQPGEVVYDPHPLDLSAVPPGHYSVDVQAYTWQDQVKQRTTSGDQWLQIGTLDR